MALSADFTVNGNSNPRAHAAAYGSTVNLALLGLGGSKIIEWSIVGASKAGTTFPTITAAGSPAGATASFVMPNDPGDSLGRAFLVKLRLQNERESAEQYAVVGAANVNSIIPIVPNEMNFRDAVQGWADTVNQGLAIVGGGAPAAETGITISPGTNQDNLTPGGDATAWANASWLFIDPSADVDFSGFTPTTKPKRVVNLGGSNKTCRFLHEVTSTNVNRLLTERKQITCFGPRARGYMEYDATAQRWRITKLSTEAADYFDQRTSTSASPVLLKSIPIPDETSAEIKLEGHAWYSDQRRRLLAQVSVHRHAGTLTSPQDGTPTFDDLPIGVTAATWGGWSVVVNNTAKTLEVYFAGDGSHVVGTTIEGNVAHTADA